MHDFSAAPASTPSPAMRGGLLPAARDELALGQRRGLVACVAVAHGVLGWGLMQVSAVHEAVDEVSPTFVSMVTPPAAPTPPPPSPPMPSPATRSSPKVTPAPPQETAARVVTAPTAQTTFTSLPPPAEPTVPAADVPAIVTPPPPVVLAEPAPSEPQGAPHAATPAPPKLIPASEVQYLEPPAPLYPRLSRRLGEAGRVLVRALIDEAGVPRSVVLAQSSGHARLDEAALVAVRDARFRPAMENGRATAGWVTAPIDFELEP